MVYRIEERPRQLRARPTEAQLAVARRRMSHAEQRLAEARMVRARIASEIRSLLIRRNEAAAMALADNVAPRAIAEVTGMKAIDVKRVAGSIADVAYTGTTASLHLEHLAAITSSLEAAVAERERAEQQLLTDAREAIESGECDVFRVAAAAAVSAERVREILRRG